MAAAFLDDDIKGHASAVMIVLDVYPQIMREMICNDFPPKIVLKLIENNQTFKKNLKSTEEKMISNMESYGYNHLDISLLYKIIRYFDLLPTPKQGWGKKPARGDIDKADDVERMKNYRNDIIHCPPGDLSDSERHDIFQQSIEIAKRMDNRIGFPQNGFESKVEKIRSYAVKQEKYIELLEKCAEYRARLQETAESPCFNLYYGNDIKIKTDVQDDQQASGDSTSQCTIYLRDPNFDVNAVIQMLDVIKETLRKGYYDISLEGAAIGSLHLLVTIHNKCFMTKDKLHKAIKTFLREFFVAASISFKQGQIYTVVLGESDIFVADYEKLNDLDYLNKRTSPVLKLNVKVKNSAFRNEIVLFGEVSRFITGLYNAVDRQNVPLNGSAREVLIRSDDEGGINSATSSEAVQCHQLRHLDFSRLFVAAIDFGTTYSRCAFSTGEDMITVCKFDLQASNINSKYTTTSLLLDKHKEFKAFGYDADDEYLNLTMLNDSMEDFYYFRRFKMALYNENISLETEIAEEGGKKMKALDIFCIAIKYLKEVVIKNIKGRFSSTKDEDVQYVLTVPALWDEQAKFFIRKAAEKAGICRDHLTLELESEAVLMYCNKPRPAIYRKGNTLLQTIKTGMKCMVIDLGGGTANITVHQHQRDQSLQDVITPSGGPWGGTAVDKSFLNFMVELFGEDVIDGFKKQDFCGYILYWQQFEWKKIISHYERGIVMLMPMTLIELLEKLKGDISSHIKKTKYKDSVTFDLNRLHIKADTFRNLFQSAINELIQHLNEIFENSELSDLKDIILVGGFSESSLVRMAVKNNFGSNRNIIIPDEIELAVLKGAVSFVHQKKKLTRRVLRKTSGIPNLTK